MLAKIFGSSCLGISATVITIEVNYGRGVGYNLVGLPDNAIRESNHRIAAALSNNGYRIPGKKITINLAPADMRKEGAAYDLPIAMGILISSGQLVGISMEDTILMGELSLDGHVQPIKGALPIALQARADGFKSVILPAQNACEAAVVEGIDVLGVENLHEVIDHVLGRNPLQPVQADVVSLFEQQEGNDLPDFSDVKGQEGIKRCMEIAAAGSHNIILIGPPGSGKTMLAKRLPTILPPMSLEESLETTKIHSVAGHLNGSALMTRRPFRNPHHTISDVALVGGGSYPQPGEISLAHNGVLFLDELPEFKRSVLEVMRQPLEDREVTISRAKFSVTYPSSFMLVASMNPSPSGFFNDANSKFRSTPYEMQRYLGKISGPLLDRIDLHVEVTPVPFEKLSESRQGESSNAIRERVTRARRVQQERFAAFPEMHANAQMRSKQLRAFCALTSSCAQLLDQAMQRLQLSARAYDRILKVSRTIADLDGATQIETLHISEAIQYRNLDREGWLG